MTMLTGILIDPENFTVTDVEVLQNDIHAIYDLIGVQCFDVATVSRLRNERSEYDQLSIFVDDEGLYVNERCYFGLISAHGQRLRPHQTQLAGKGLVLGPPDDEGNTLSCPIKAADLFQHVCFMIEFEGGGRPVLAEDLDMLRHNLEHLGLELKPWRDSEDRTAGSFRVVSFSNS